MGINFLYEEYRKDAGKIEKLLDSKIEITEKLDGSRFVVQSQPGSDLIYFKRRDILISKIDRTLSKYYEKAIFHFENLPEEKTEQMPDGWRFGMEYFPNLKPVTIAYDRLPLNNLVLTDIQVKDPKDRTIEVISDKATLDKWADILEVEAAPILFEGTLTDVQKRKILDFLNTPYNDLIVRFKTENFTTFILTLLNPQLSTSFLHNDLEKDIDSLVFRFDGKEVFRVSNPEITLRKQQKRDDKPSDIYNLTLVFLQEFLTILDFKKIKLREKTFEARYIEFICDVFNKYVLTPNYKTNFAAGVDFDLPHFLTREESGVNFKFVTNPETLRHLEASNTNRELFKILLASMRSHKKKPSGFFTKELIYHHNKLVDDIADYISNNISETAFYSFDEFRSVYLTESDSWHQEFGKEFLDEAEHTEYSDHNSTFPTYDQTKSEPHVENRVKPDNTVKKTPIDVLRKMYTDDEKEPAKKTTKVCILKGKFHPFHNGHYTVVEDAAADSNMRIFLVITTKKLPPNYFSPELHKQMLDQIVEQHPSVKGYVFTNGRTIQEIQKDMPNKITIGAFAGSEEECEDVKLQMGEDFMTIPTTKHIGSNAVLQKVRDEDFSGYKKLMPKSLHNFFYKIKNELDEK